MTEDRLDSRRYDDPPSWVANIHAQSDDDPRDIDGESRPTSGWGEDVGEPSPIDEGKSGARDEGYPTHYWENTDTASATVEGDPPPPSDDEGFGGH